MTRLLADVDPFDLPEWLGATDVVWVSEGGVRAGHLVPGRLTGGHPEIACDLLAVDEAYPQAVADEDTRRRAHQTWRHGQVLLVESGRRLTLAVPGTSFTADTVLEALGRLAGSVGASPDRYAARLSVGAADTHHAGSGR